MKAAFGHMRLLIDLASMKLFVRLLGRYGELLDSHLFFYDRYSELADYHRRQGRMTKADRLDALAERYFQIAPDDDEPPAAAMAMPVPRPPIRTCAVSRDRVATAGRSRPTQRVAPRGMPTVIRPRPLNIT